MTKWKKAFRGYTGWYWSVLNPLSQQDRGGIPTQKGQTRKCTDSHLVQVSQGFCPSRWVRTSPEYIHNIQSLLHWYLIVCLQSAELSGHATKRRCDICGNSASEHKEHHSNHCAFELYVEILCSLSACFLWFMEEVGHQQNSAEGSLFRRLTRWRVVSVMWVHTSLSTLITSTRDVKG